MDILTDRPLGIFRFAFLLGMITALMAGGAAKSSSPAGVRFLPDAPNELTFPAQEAKFVRFVIAASAGSQPCIDELEIYGPDAEGNIAISGIASASSCLSGYPIHRIEHLNDGRYGNSYSWIAASSDNEWAQIELPEPTLVERVVFSRDREGQYRDRMPRIVEIRLSCDGQNWDTVLRIEAETPPAPRYTGYVPPAEMPDDADDWDAILDYAFTCERETWHRMNATDHLSPLVVERSALPDGDPYWGRIARLDELERVLVQMEEMLVRLEGKGVDVAAERDQLALFRTRQATLAWGASDVESEDALYRDTRLAKRRLMLCDPDLESAQKILFAKRHPYLATHNYSDVLDSQFRSGGGICVLEIPRHGDRLAPSQAELTVLFDAKDGIARDPIADFDAESIYFAYRPSEGNRVGQDPYWKLWEMNVDGTRQVRLGDDAPFHDYFPCPLPDGGLSFISTRCRARFLCWRPQAFVLFRMGPGAAPLKPLSYANLSEWTPAMMNDGRLLWTRSEYIDKGANFGHTLWSVHPDGTHPELIFGNNTNNCYMNAHEVPDSRELVCTLVSHGGDHNGPIGLIDLAKGPFDPSAITNITPDVRPQYDMSWLRQECFRDPIPVSRDYFLVSHAPADHFGLYLIDRYGNRELLYMDPGIGSMRPRPLSVRPVPPVVRGSKMAPEPGMGHLLLADVYQGLSSAVPRGTVKYIRVCQEVRAELEQLDTGSFRADHGPVFQDFYATPIHQVSGPFGWPSYVAKASLGLVPVEEDGSANFLAPAGRVLYFQALDENFNELQRMRSVVQLQPGEQRSCVGCHEDRQSAPPVRQTVAFRREPSQLEQPPWGAEPFSYENVVQPVWDSQCVRCHDADDERGFNLTGDLDPELVPASYRTLISGGWIHYFDWGYAVRHSKAEPTTFGTLESRLWEILNEDHYDVELTEGQIRRVKCWTDLNCPLWPDYVYRPDRRAAMMGPSE
jgi:hypothetical protein